MYKTNNYNFGIRLRLREELDRLKELENFQTCIDLIECYLKTIDSARDCSLPTTYSCSFFSDEEWRKIVFRSKR
jgi:hypothetical protein